MRSTWKTTGCQSAIVRSFWKKVGGRTPVDAVIRLCDKMTNDLKRREPPFQSDRYEYAELLGVRVLEKNIPDQKLHGILSKCPTGYMIEVNHQDPPERRSFTVCHELGHIQMLTLAETVLGRDRVQKHRNGSDEEERLSDLFAANLLMPRRKFRESANATTPSMKSLIFLARTFRTSIGAAARRIVDLNLWPCTLLWCLPEKLLDGTFAVKVMTVINSRKLPNPLVSRKGYVRWGIDAVYESYNNKSLSCSTVALRHPGRNLHERWSIECLYQEGMRGDSVLALLLPQ